MKISYVDQTFNPLMPDKMGSMELITDPPLDLIDFKGSERQERPREAMKRSSDVRPKRSRPY